MGVFVVEGGDNWKVSLATERLNSKTVLSRHYKACVDAARQVNARWMTVVPGFSTANRIWGCRPPTLWMHLDAAPKFFEPHGLIMVLEPLVIHLGSCSCTSDQTYEICKAVRSPSCKILYDIYHMQRNEGNLIANIDATWDRDSLLSRSVITHGRKEPKTGEINYKEHLYAYSRQRISGCVGYGTWGSG